MKSNCLILFAVLISTLKASPISLDSIVRRPIISKVSLSPDGQFVAAIYSNEKDRQLLMTKHIFSQEEFLLKERNNGDIYRYRWASNTRIVYNVSKMKLYHLHMGVIDRTLKDKNVFCFKNVGWPVNGLINDTNHAMIKIRDRSSYTTIGRINVHTLKYNKIDHGIKGLLDHCIIDFDGNLRVISTYQKGNDGQFQYYYRNSKKDSWYPIIDKNEDLIYYKTHSQDDHLYVSGAHEGEKAKSLYLYNVKTDSLKDCIYSDSLFDVNCNLYFFSNVYEEPSNTTLKGIIYDASKPKSVWFDKKIESIQNTIDSLLPQTSNLITDSDRYLHQFLVLSYSDVKPEEYYVFHAPSHSLKLLFKSRPWISQDHMSPMESIWFKTRDSLSIHAYLTKPLHGSAPYPTIILVHGGPWARDHWGFEPEVQALASRGYAVFQINYRGSIGYGEVISKKHRFSFKKMHNDITDGTQHLIKCGIADPKRIAIMGGSFGGYLSICGVAFEPDLYRCAISNAGVFDWRKHVRSKFGKYNNFVFDFFNSNLGNGDKKAYLEEISPINAVKNIKVPVMVCGGTNDSRVSISQSVKLLAALRRADVTVERYLQAKEGHGFYKQKNVLKYYNKLFAFLHENMK